MNKGLKIFGIIMSFGSLFLNAMFLQDMWNCIAPYISSTLLLINYSTALALMFFKKMLGATSLINSSFVFYNASKYTEEQMDFIEILGNIITFFIAWIVITKIIF